MSGEEKKMKIKILFTIRFDHINIKKANFFGINQLAAGKFPGSNKLKPTKIGFWGGRHRGFQGVPAFCDPPAYIFAPLGKDSASKWDPAPEVECLRRASMTKNISFLIWLCCSMLLLIGGCGWNDTTAVSSPTIDYANYNVIGKDWSVKFNNNGSHNLVAVKNRLTLSNVISGLPAFASEWGLAASEDLFDQSEVFVIIFITEEEFLRTYPNIETAEVFYTREVHFNKGVADSYVYNINDKVGGDGLIDGVNRTGMLCLIKESSPRGDLLLALGAYQLEALLRVAAPADYKLVAVFEQWAPELNRLITVYPTTANGKWIKWAFNLKPGETEQIIIDESYLDPTAIDMGHAIVNVYNASDIGIEIKRGSEKVYNNSRTTIFDPLEQSSFQLWMPNIGDEFVDEVTVGNLHIDIMDIGVTIPSFTYRNGYWYNIVIGGDSSGLTVESIEEVGRIPIESLFETD